MLDDRADEFVRFRQPDGGIPLPGRANPVRIEPWMNSVVQIQAGNSLQGDDVQVKPSSDPKDDKRVADGQGTPSGSGTPRMRVLLSP
jgi:hypothetical protein